MGAKAQTEELLRSNCEFQSCIRELAETNDSLRREVAAAARKLQTIMHALALAAERVGDGPLAQVIRTVAAAPSDLSSVTACGLDGGQPCAQGRRPGAPCGASAPPQVLSRREREVLRLLADGIRSPSIAPHLGIAIATVEVHRRNIMRKLGLHTIASLTKYAVREGLSSL